MPKTISRSLLVAAITLIAAGAWAQPPDKNSKPSTDPSEKPKNVKVELKEVYKKWLENDVSYINCGRVREIKEW